MKRYALIFALALATTGCATNYGNNSITNQNKVSSIHAGKSTTKDVRALLGKPSNVALESNGEQVWEYSNVQVKGTAMIPFVGLFGNQVHQDTLTIRFNRRGVVTATGSGGDDNS